jgi:hypothetical protein
MEQIKKVNISGAMNSIEIEESFTLPRNGLYKPHSVRAIATQIAENDGKKFSVSVKPEEIVVIRLK